MRKLFAIIIIFLMGQILVLAQTNSGYWAHQFGPKGLLLNGAVISSPGDETSVYYNPGSIGMDDDLGFLFSFVTPTFSILKIDNLLGKDEDITTSSFRYSPSFFGVRLRPFNNKKITLGITNFRRYRTKIKFGKQATAIQGADPQSVLRVDLDFTKELIESWRGVGLSYNLTEELGIGISQFSVWHDQTYNLDLNGEILDPNRANSINEFSRAKTNFELDIKGAFITKLGLSYRNENLCFGLTYTSPLYGSIWKEAEYNLESQQLSESNEGFTNSARNTTSNVTYKTPHVFGLGFDIHWPSSSLSISAEYFTSINNYSIIKDQTDAFDDISLLTRPVEFFINSQSDDVLNVAVGLQKKITEKHSWIIGFRTDRSENRILTGSHHSDFNGYLGDVFHASGGALINLKNNQFACGVDLGFGSRDNIRQILDLSDLNKEAILDYSSESNGSSRFQSFLVFITYDFLFDKMRSK